MADRRFLSKSVLCQDKFLDMKNSSQVLYFYLVLYADDDGFVDCVKTVKRLSKARQIVSVNIKMHIFYQIIMYSFHQEDSSVAAYIWARRKDFPFIGTTVA